MASEFTDSGSEAGPNAFWSEVSRILTTGSGATKAVNVKSISSSTAATSRDAWARSRLASGEDDIVNDRTRLASRGTSSGGTRPEYSAMPTLAKGSKGNGFCEQPRIRAVPSE